MKWLLRACVNAVRLPEWPRWLRQRDPALYAMNDFQLAPPHTVSAQQELDQICDQMFDCGERAFLVVRGPQVLGLISAEDVRGPRAARLLAPAARCGLRLRVGEVMTPAAQVPAIDWQVLQSSRVRDLLEIFEATGVGRLMVLETEPSHNAVRGLVERSRLEQTLQR